ncbi:uncharacterized protein N7483_005584 [Penicillium malachiteum]|uniref:uncharacterized protein n=1 Tax=Penicillium malachiteum TaxID=1324776 RepID=UPI002548DAA2|nr:uncharacterized protein N7483_005584 [Penicillium malachiteum]KAJ5731076.1 hypothetical protein N7483_005584 [Penicillium malachiteum]
MSLYLAVSVSSHHGSPQSEEELANTKTDEELQREEDEIFTAVPETLGIGAPLPEKAADGSWNRTELGSNDKLRKQLLGKNYDRFMKAAAANKAQLKTTPATQATTSNTQDNDSEDDEEGRTATIGQKKRNVMPKKVKAVVNSEDQEKDVQGEQDASTPNEVPVRQAPSKGRKKATSYLDELLAERAKKRKKK